MGNYNFEKDEKFNIEKDVKVTIKLDKSCYFPGEVIKGTLNFTAKKNLKNPLLANPEIKFNLTQLEQYWYEVGSGDDAATIFVKRDIILFSATLYFSTFKNANIMIGIQIPFSFQIPLNTLPSLNLSEDYTKHFLTINIPYIETKKSVFIIIKNFQVFSVLNHLIQMPLIVNFSKKIGNKGKINCDLKFEKNVFYFHEGVKFNLKLDCSELKTNIYKIEISINTLVRGLLNVGSKKSNINYKKVAFQKCFQFQKNPYSKYELNEILFFPKDANYLPDIYHTLDQMPIEEISKNFNKFKISPPSYGGLITVNYIFKVKIFFDTFLSFSEEFEVPLDFSPSLECANFPGIDPIQNLIQNSLNKTIINYNDISQMFEKQMSHLDLSFFDSINKYNGGFVSNITNNNYNNRQINNNKIEDSYDWMILDKDGTSSQVMSLSTSEETKTAD